MSEKEDKEGHPTQQITQQQREPNPTTTEPTHCNNWPLPHPLPRREGRNHRDTPNGLLLVAYGAVRVCVGTERPLPRPLPRREGRDYRDTPIVLLNVAYGAICGCITRCSAHFASLFVYIESSVKYVHSVIICLYVIMSINIKAQSGPSPVPSPVGRGVITEIPLTSCCSLFTVLVGLM